MKLNPRSQQPPPRRKLVSGVFSIAAALVLMALQPAHAGMQGNMPTPVQTLPKYPPVVCVATNWATETCEDRQTPLPRANPLRAFNRQEPEVPRSGKTTVLYYEPGGILPEHEARFKALAESGDDVEVRSLCGSACTMIMAYVPRDRLCFAVTASLWFHEARSGATAETATPSVSTTQYMLDKYPPDIRLWLRDRGGVEKMTVEKWWVLHASELWEMGYRKCAPEATPVPMTQHRTGWKSAEEDRRGAKR
jgi:hypothetical protein